jgi:hypothetical protein
VADVRVLTTFGFGTQLTCDLSALDSVARTSTGASTRTTLWDLVLLSPLFLIWGLLWAATIGSSPKARPDAKPDDRTSDTSPTESSDACGTTNNNG